MIKKSNKKQNDNVLKLKTNLASNKKSNNSKKKKNQNSYSSYINKKSDELNKKPVEKGSVIVANLSDYEKLPKNVKDHKRESVVVLKDSNKELGVVFIHGVDDVDGTSRMKKKEAGLWELIKKNNEDVFVDLDIRENDANGNPIKQGSIFKNTGVVIEDEQMEKVEKHIYSKNGRKSHNIRNTVVENKKKRDKKKKAN